MIYKKLVSVVAAGILDAVLIVSPSQAQFVDGGFHDGGAFVRGPAFGGHAMGGPAFARSTFMGPAFARGTFVGRPVFARSTFVGRLVFVRSIFSLR
jgi:hypothetical protein